MVGNNEMLHYTNVREISNPSADVVWITQTGDAAMLGPTSRSSLPADQPPRVQRARARAGESRPPPAASRRT